MSICDIARSVYPHGPQFGPRVAGAHIDEPLPKDRSRYDRIAGVLSRLGYDNVYSKTGDGHQGWPNHAPSDKIIVTCSPEQVPPALVAQLREGGRMVIPVGERYRQNLILLKKVNGKMEVETLQPTFFVPMTGRAERDRRVLPDPVNPRIQNGDFEEIVEDTGELSAWYYQRQLELISGRNAPSGSLK